MLLRHAKSSWNQPHLHDHDRPLNRRGRYATLALRDHFTTMQVVPDVVLCSTAARTVETWKGIAPAFENTPQVELRDDLYGASADHMLNALRTLPHSVESVLLIGHNPGIEDLAVVLAGSGDHELLDRMQTKYPTGALTTLEVSGSWSQLGADTAELVEFVVPRELPRPTD